MNIYINITVIVVVVITAAATTTATINIIIFYHLYTRYNIQRKKKNTQNM